ASYAAPGTGPSSSSPAGCASGTASTPPPQRVPTGRDGSPTHEERTTMPNYETPEPISVTLEVGVGNVRVTASDRTDTTVDVRPSDDADESDVKAAAQIRVDYANGTLQVT